MNGGAINAVEEELTGKALGASTVVVINQVDAGGAILALADTIVQVFSASSSTPAFEA